MLLLLFVGFNEPTTLADDTPNFPYDPFVLGFEDNCYDCHQSEVEDPYYFCHELIPTGSYISRAYLKVHYIWVAATLNVPAAIYMPPEFLPDQTEVKVNLFGRAYIPARVHVPVGTTVTWTNLDIEVHNVTSGIILGSDKQPFASGALNPGASYSYTFDQPGTFYYYREFSTPVEILPQVGLYSGSNPGMLGMVIVGDPEIDDVVTEVTDIVAFPEEHG
jgi:plastocyanin